MKNVLFIIMILAACYLLALMIAARLFKTAVFSIIEVFRAHGALTQKSARRVDELPLLPKAFQLRFLRDYRPEALRFLMTEQIIVRTEDERLYLSEAGFGRFARSLEGRDA